MQVMVTLCSADAPTDVSPTDLRDTSFACALLLRALAAPDSSRPRERCALLRRVLGPRNGAVRDPVAAAPTAAHRAPLPITGWELCARVCKNKSRRLRVHMTHVTDRHCCCRWPHAYLYNNVIYSKVIVTKDIIIFWIANASSNVGLSHISCTALS